MKLKLHIINPAPEPKVPPRPEHPLINLLGKPRQAHHAEPVPDSSDPALRAHERRREAAELLGKAPKHPDSASGVQSPQPDEAEPVTAK